MYIKFQYLKFLSYHFLDGLSKKVEKSLGCYHIDNKSYSPNEFLHSFLSFASIEEIEFALERGAQVNCRDKRNKYQTPLHAATTRCCEKVFCLLINKGANINAKDSDGHTALSRMIIRDMINWRSQILRIVQLLLDNHANINLRTKGGKSPLFYAVEVGDSALVELLIDRNANVNLKTDDNISPLHIAARKGHEHIVRLLLDNYADIDAQDDEGITPLHNAISEGEIGVVELLVIRNACVNARTKRNITPLHTAAKFGDEGIVAILLRENADLEVSEFDTCYTPLHYAIENGNQRVIDLLLNAKKTDLNSRITGNNKSSNFYLHGFQAQFSHRDERIALEKLLSVGGDYFGTIDQNKKTPARRRVKMEDIKSKYKFFALEMALRGDKMEKSERILAECGLSFDADYIGDHEFLHTCVKRGHYQIVECLLMNYGVDPNSVHNGRTLLHDAIENGHYKMVKLVIKSKCDVNAKSMGERPIYHAITSQHEGIVELLLKSGADIENNGLRLLHTAVNRDNIGICRLLIDRGLDVNARDIYSRTALHYASQPDIIELLIQCGADIDIKDDYGLTALHLNIKRDRNSFSMFRNLLEYDLDTDMQDNYGNTALHLAVLKNRYYTKRLLDKGYDVNATNNQGRTPLDCAYHRTNNSPSNGYNLRRNIANIVEHIMKLHIAGLYVRNNVDEFSNISLVKLTTDDCRAELTKIQEIILRCNISLYDALIKCNIPRLDEELIEILELIDYKEFPIYGKLMETNLKKSNLRSKLISLGKRSFHILNKGKKLPMEVIEKIVCELDDRDLKNLISCTENIKNRLKKPSNGFNMIKTTSVSRKESLL